MEAMTPAARYQLLIVGIVLAVALVGTATVLDIALPSRDLAGEALAREKCPLPGALTDGANATYRAGDATFYTTAAIRKEGAVITVNGEETPILRAGQSATLPDATVRVTSIFRGPWRRRVAFCITPALQLPPGPPTLPPGPYRMPVACVPGELPATVTQDFLGMGMKEAGPWMNNITVNGVPWMTYNITVNGVPYMTWISGRLRDAGTRTVITRMAWSTVEVKDDQFEWAGRDSTIDAIADSGLTPVVAISNTPAWAAATGDKSGADPPDDMREWEEFVSAAVRRYGPNNQMYGPARSGTVRDWKIWNEPNGRGFWRGTREQYIELLNSAYATIKSEDSGARVWAPGVVYHENNKASTGYNNPDAWVDAIIAGGRFDVFTIHVYLRDPVEIRDVTRRVRQKLDAAGKKEVPLAVTELNIFDQDGGCPYGDLKEAQQAENLRRAYACVADGGAASAYWFTATDRPSGSCPSATTEGRGWIRTGVFTRDPPREKLSYYALREIGVALGTASGPIAPPSGTITASPNPCVIQSGAATCAGTLSWNSAGRGYVQLWRYNIWRDSVAPANVSCAPAGKPRTFPYQVSPRDPQRFVIYSAIGCTMADRGAELSAVTVSAAPTDGYDAAYVSASVPELMIVGQPYVVSVTMLNNGTAPWIGGVVSLRAVNIDYDAWQPGKVTIPAGTTVPPGKKHIFTFNVTAAQGKDVRLFTWKMVGPQFFGNETPVRWVVTDAPYYGLPIRKLVKIWDYVIGDPTTRMCLDGRTICQTIYPIDATHTLVVRDDTLIVKYFRNDALDTIGVLKDGIAQGAQNANVQLRCLTRTPGSCDNGPLPSTPLSAYLPVLPASAINRHLVTEEGLDVQMKQTFWWNPISYETCQPTATAGNITSSGKIFLLESYDFGGDVGVQQDVLVYEGVGGYPTDVPLAQLNPWGTMRMERFLFVKGKGYYQEDGIEDPDCRDTPSQQTCNGIYSRFFSFQPATWRWIDPTPVPYVDYCPNV